MKLLKISLFALSTLFMTSAFGQFGAVIFDYNNVSTRINERGSLFNDPMTAGPSYETPVNGGNHLIYQGAFWFGGTDQNGDLKLAAHLYGNDYDYYQGPFSTTGDYNNPTYLNNHNLNIWTLTRGQINNHINNYDQANYVAPNGILDWPGNGDPSIGVATQLAPYVDIDSNGVYEPQLGDYPCIKGDAAVYQIFHEDLAHEESGGSKIGAEIHIMAYQYVDNTYLNNTTFIETTVYNRGQNSFNDFKTSFFIDTDIGFSEDDYIGSAPSENLVYAYNGDDFDEGSSAGSGYGTNPPAVGFVSLNNDVAFSGTFYRGDLGTPQTIEPTTPNEFWNYMNGKWKDGSDWTIGGNGYGGSNGSTQHLFDGNPNQGTGWSEVNTDGNGTSNSPTDRKIVMTSTEKVFMPGDKLTYNYAVITNRDGNNLQNVDGLIATANAVQSFFDTTNMQCAPNGTLSLKDELKLGKINIYPNPATNQITLAWDQVKVDVIKITSYNGSVVKKIVANEKMKGEEIINLNGLSSGVYFVNVGSEVRKLVIH